METIKTLINFFSDKELSVPLGQVAILVIINSFCLLVGKHKLGLLISYVFVLFWGFILNKDYFVAILGGTSWGLAIYAISGFAMVIMFILGFFHDSKG